MSEIARLRLRNHRLVGSPFGSAEAAVRGLLAVQAQDLPAAQWALGQRVAGIGFGDLDRPLESGAILRTHLMRPTWHFVLPEDLPWLQALTSARLLAGIAARHRRLELDEETFKRAARVFEKRLSGGRVATRAELAQALSEASISPDGQRLPHLLHQAEVVGLLSSGPRQGRDTTFALLADRLPSGAARQLNRDEALGELARRYFESHGPALVADLAWWSGLTATEARRGIAAAGPTLQRIVIDGTEYWAGTELGSDPGPGLAATHLLPNLDEFTVAYRDRSALLDPGATIPPGFFPFFREATPETGVLSNVLTVAGVVRGAWRRATTSRKLLLEVRLLAPLEEAAEQSLAETVSRFGAFWGRPAELRIT